MVESPIRVLMLSKACIMGIYQRKLELIAQQNIELLVLVPSSWRDERGETPLERVYTHGYRLQTTLIALNGSFHLHFYPGLGDVVQLFRPHIVHIDEEPYNLSAWQALFHARRAGARTLFFSWQNIQRRYPPPFSWGERWVLKNVDHAIAGTESAAAVWRAKGYEGPLNVIPQFGVDPDLFTPVPLRPARPFTIGYFGRLVPEKGLHLLFRALARLGDDWRLRIIGSGPQRPELETLAHDLDIDTRIRFIDQIPSMDMPAQYREIDAFVLPSLTCSNWKEQFGRVLVEAMASGVPVVGSNSGAIPDVIGPAGLIFAEGDVDALAQHIQHLRRDEELRFHLAALGRKRVLDHFTHDRVATATATVYRQMLKEPSSPLLTSRKSGCQRSDNDDKIVS